MGKGIEKEEVRDDWVGKTNTIPADEVQRMLSGLPKVTGSGLYDEPYVEEGVVVENFCCPICDSAEYEAVRKMTQSCPGLIGPGNKISYHITGYKCNGCSAKFADPAKFSKNRQK